MHDLARIAAAELVIALALLYGAIGHLLLTGRMNLSGLLWSKAGDGFDPGRLQTLLVTLMLALTLLTNLDEMRSANRVALPSGWLLAVLGGSQGIYLVRKFHQVFHLWDRRDH